MLFLVSIFEGEAQWGVRYELPFKNAPVLGRWETAGPELIRVKDRKDADYCLGPTHEEVGG